MRRLRRQAQAAHPQSRRRVLAHGSCGEPGRLRADHQPRQAGVALLARIDLARHPARAQHRAAMAQGADLVELVADVEDRAALVGEPAQRDEQRLHRLRRQHRGRLVQDQQPRRGHQRAQDLDPLALAHRQRMHRALGIERQAVLGRERAHAGADRVQRHRLVESQPDVLRRGQRIEQREVLVDHADAQRARLRRRTRRPRCAVPQQFAGVGLHRAGDDLHQGGLAGAVLAEHRMDLARRHRQRHRVVGLHAGVLLADAAEFQAWRCHGDGRVLRISGSAARPRRSWPPGCDRPTASSRRRPVRAGRAPGPCGPRRPAPRPSPRCRRRPV